MKSTQLADAREVAVNDRSTLNYLLDSDFSVEHHAVNLEQIHFKSDGTLNWGNRCFPYTDMVHDLLVQKCMIPASFEQDLTFDQFNMLFEQRKHHKPQRLTMCISNGTVVGIGPENYCFGSATGGVARTVDLLDAMDLDKGLWEFESAIVSDVGVKVNLMIPGMTVEPEEADFIKIGWEVSNSETGGPAAKSDLFTLRLVCTNGMTQRTDRTSVYYTKMGRMSYSSKVAAFARQLSKAKTAAEATAAQLYDGIVELPLLDIDLLAVHRTIKRRIGGKLDADKVLGISRSDRIEIFNRVRERDVAEPPRPTGIRAWDVHNSVTAAATTEKLLTRRVLQEIGGSILLVAQKRRDDGHSDPFSVN